MVNKTLNTRPDRLKLVLKGSFIGRLSFHYEKFTVYGVINDGEIHHCVYFEVGILRGSEDILYRIIKNNANQLYDMSVSRNHGISIDIYRYFPRGSFVKYNN